VAFALAIAGIFGVLSYSVAARSRELGVRLALGAERKDIGWMVLRQAFTPVATGIAVGWLVALGLSRFMASFVFGTTTNTVFVPFRPKRRECRVALRALQLTFHERDFRSREDGPGPARSNDLIVGLEGHVDARAYLLRRLADQRFVEEWFEGAPIAVYLNKDFSTARTYDRQVDGRADGLSVEPGKRRSPLRTASREGATTFDLDLCGLVCLGALSPRHDDSWRVGLARTAYSRT